MKIDEIRELAARGPVRLIVELRLPAFTSHADAGYASTVAGIQQRFVVALKASGALLIEAIDNQPMAVVELTAAQIDGLLATRLVRSVTVDQARKAQ